MIQNNLLKAKNEVKTGLFLFELDCSFHLKLPEIALKVVLKLLARDKGYSVPQLRMCFIVWRCLNIKGLLWKVRFHQQLWQDFKKDKCLLS